MVRCLAAALAVCFVVGLAHAQTVLLDFGSPHCGPCQQLAPTIDRLAQDGYPVRKVDVTQDRELAAKYRVNQVPCLVMLVDGREVDRMIGGGDYDVLRNLIERHTAKPMVTQASAQMPRPSLSGASWDSEAPLAAKPASGLAPPSGPAPMAHIDPAGFEAKLLSSSVRLKVEDAEGFGYGTGTIVDTMEDSALVATCGHLFRSSQGKGRITVEVFAHTPQGLVVVEQLAGELISFDDQRDVGLVGIRPTRPVAVSRVAPRPALRENDRVWSVGCSRGDNPTIDRTRVTSVQHNHVNAANRPVEGRSGGGLFDEQGQLVGICTGAYQETDEGLYADLASLHAELDRNKLSFVYNRPAAQVAVAHPSAPTPGSTRIEQPPASRLAPIPDNRNLAASAAATSNGWPASAPRVQPVSHERVSLSPAEQAAFEEIVSRAADNEVVVIVRPKQPGGRSEVLTLESVSPQFVEQLRQLREPANGSRIAGRP